MIRWRVRGPDGHWLERDPIAAPIDALLNARSEVARALSEHLLRAGASAMLGLCPRTFAVAVAGRAGAWPLPGAASGVDAMWASYAIFQPIDIWRDTGWYRLDGVFENAAGRRIREKLARVPGADALISLWRVTHARRLRPSSAQVSRGAWLWEATDPAGYSVVGSGHRMREVLATPPERLTIYVPPSGFPDIIINAPPTDPRRV